MLTMTADLPGIRLGPKMIAVFLAATVGVVVGAPLAVLLVGSISPGTVGGTDADAVWRGLSTVAGSWIGGGANQAAMKEVFQPSDDLFSAMVAVDVIVANIWMGILLWMAGSNLAIDRRLRADRTALDALDARLREIEKTAPPRPSRTTDLMTIAALGFMATGIATVLGGWLAGWFEAEVPWSGRFSLTSAFFWLVVISTTIGVALSFARPVRRLESAGASKIASVFLYLLVATIGLKMDLLAIGERPGLFAIGLVWIGIQAVFVLGTTVLLRAPIFFAAVGSQANIGGAASAPVVAAAFDPRLAPVGVLLAVVGYALGTYGAGGAPRSGGSPRRMNDEDLIASTLALRRSMPANPRPDTRARRGGSTSSDRRAGRSSPRCATAGRPRSLRPGADRPRRTRAEARRDRPARRRRIGRPRADPRARDGTSRWKTGRLARRAVQRGDPHAGPRHGTDLDAGRA